MHVAAPEELIEQVKALPAARPLMARLPQYPVVHLVGGAVRDLLRDGRPFDLDLVVEGDAALLAAKLGGERRVHDRFGTSTVELEGFSYDIARARRERYRRPGALPEVEPAPLEEDLRRRDFTVNAIALALGGEVPGALTAIAHALEDLADGVLRVLHDRSFLDDPTRMLRLARYAARLGFEIEPWTRALARDAIDEGALRTVSGPRIGNELRLLAREEDPLAALRCLGELGLDRAIHPRFGLRDEALARRALELLPADARRERLVIAVAARDLHPGELRELLDALGFEAGDRDAIVSASAGADAVANELERARRPSEIAAALSSAGVELAAVAGALGPALQVEEWLARLRDIKLEIDGDDLLAAGVPEGPAIGRGLQAALDAKVDGHAHAREEELAHALQAATEAG